MAAKITIVTGASGNLGQAVVENFLKEGYTVIGTTTHINQAGNNTAEAKLEMIEVDLMNEESAHVFVEDVIQKYGRIDATVLTVGGFAMGSVSQTKTTDVLKQYKLNFETAYNTARPVFMQMLKQKSGRIFLIGARPGLEAEQSSGMIAYGLAKSLLFTLAELMNNEAKGMNVVTSIIVPSIIDTPQNRKSMPDADTSKWVKAEAIADVISFYCTDEAAALRAPVIKVYNNA
jgi:NAD(P)-dependent dehydrogenase (short-subunit alcohol dehydrogenase family)